MGDLDSILEYIDQIQLVSDETRFQRESAFSLRESAFLRNVFRDDKDPHEPGVYSDKLLNEVPREQDKYIKVKKIL